MNFHPTAFRPLACFVSAVWNQRVLRCSLLLVLIVQMPGAWSLPYVAAAPSDAVVGDGTPESCDGNALEAAINSGGMVTFNCGGAHTILANTMVVDAGNAVVIDGEGNITISGEGLRQIFIVNAGASLTLNNITLSDGNWPGRGGALVVYGQATLNNSTVRDSQSPCWVCDGSDGSGGAIAVEDGGTLVVNGSRILNNWAAGAGGGIALFGGSVAIANSALEDNNTGGAGGALWSNAGTVLTMVDSSVANNGAADRGGGLLNQGEARIERSTFRGNRANGGGAMVFLSGNASLENVTISGNTAIEIPGGIRSAVAPGTGGVSLTNVTLYGNTYLDSNANLVVDAESVAPQLRNTIIQGTIDGANCYLGVAPVSLGYNQSSDASCALTGTGDIQNANIALAPLADNGGPTQTHLATVGSSKAIESRL